MTKSPTKQEVEKVVNGGGAQLPAEFVSQIAADAGLGSESVDRDDMTIPFIKIAQALSEEVNKRESAYIEGLEVGDFFNTATKTFWKGESGFTMIPVFYEREYIEWVPRSRGGGFQGKHPESILDKTTTGERGENLLPNGNEIVVTGTWYVIIVDRETLDFDQAVLSLSKTQLKKSKTLMTQLKQLLLPHPSGKGKFNPPLFYNLVDVTSVPESNDQGNWMGWKMTIAGNVFQLGDHSIELYEMAKMMLEGVRSGKLKAEAPRETEAGGNVVEGESRRNVDADIPF